MTKLITFFGAILFASVILTSCGGGSTDKKEEVKTEDTLKASIDTLKVSENSTTESTAIKLTLNKKLIPQKIDYDGKPELEYTINNKIIVLDSYSESDSKGKYIQMQFNNKKVKLKMQEKNSSKERRVYSNDEYTVSFYDITLGACAGEGAQFVSGKLLIETKSEQNTVDFKGSDALYSSKKCREIGNG